VAGPARLADLTGASTEGVGQRIGPPRPIGGPLPGHDPHDHPVGPPAGPDADDAAALVVLEPATEAGHTMAVRQRAP
jgi:hypothetical protein